MLMFKGVLVSLLLPVWALVGLLTVALVSYLVSIGEDPASANALAELGISNGTDGSFESALLVVFLVGFGIHVVAAIATSRAVAAMAGSVGGVIATAVAALIALAVAVAPDGQRADALQTLAQPAGVGAIGVISLWFGFRAYLAHTGRWRYAKGHVADSWDGDYGD